MNIPLKIKLLTILLVSVLKNLMGHENLSFNSFFANMNSIINFIFMQIHGNCETITQAKFKEKGTYFACNYLDIEHRIVGTMHSVFENGIQAVSIIIKH